MLRSWCPEPPIDKYRKKLYFSNSIWFIRGQLAAEPMLARVSSGLPKAAAWILVLSPPRDLPRA
jgi:hypothetical protein